MKSTPINPKSEHHRINRQFASDNYAGICPQAWDAMQQANTGHTPAYGEDPWTTKATDTIRNFFETNCEVFFVFNGTAANSLAVSALCQPYHSVICHETAHLETDECGATEFFSNGTKILLVPGSHGKVDLAEVEKTVKRRSDIHYPKPRMLSLSQATEVGTVYTADELSQAGELCDRLGLSLHVDGARFVNALAHLNTSPADLTWKAGVDVLCFGGTKNGMAVGDAIVFFNIDAARDFEFRCKQAGQLASKMRFLSAPWISMLENNHWHLHAANANRCASILETKLQQIPGVRLLYPSQANSVFVELPPLVIETLRSRGWLFYTFIGVGGARFVCAWDSTETDVEALAKDVQQAMNNPDSQPASPTHGTTEDPS